MRHFIAFFLMLVLSNTSFAQEVQTKPQQEKPKVAVKTKKAAKTKPKTKLKPKVTVIEAATKDGKAVTLKSNGTWEYVKAETTVKPSPTPDVKPTPTPSAKPTATPTPSANPNPVTKSAPVITAEKNPVPKPTPNEKTKAFLLSKECDLTLKDAPSIRGLKLGMPRDEADRIIPPDRVRYLDSSAITAYPQFGKTAGFENVYQVSAEFFEEKLNALEIVYDPNAVKWKNAKEFAENLSQNFNIPNRFWKFESKEATVSEMRCSDFSINIDSELNEVRLQKRTELQKTVQIKEESKKVFKP
jgi:hypothetical protein